MSTPLKKSEALSASSFPNLLSASFSASDLASFVNAVDFTRRRCYIHIHIAVFGVRWMFLLAEMGEDDDWGLSAVVRSCRPSGEAPATRNCLWEFPRPLEHPWVTANEKRDACISISEAFESRSGVLAKGGGSLSPVSAAVLSSGAMAEPKSNQPPLRRKVDRPASSQTARSRRRKSKQKRVVRHVTADGLSSDMWAWRKYGQKPIKGSPFPRGYYRCSSSKDCAARKQVERSRTDPEAFILTYTGEHKHPKPTHRNSLAGSTRPKLPTTLQPTMKQEVLCPRSPRLSPTTPLSDSAILRRNNCGDEGVEEEIEMEDDEEGELLVEDIMMVDDDLLFMSSEEGNGRSPTADVGALFDGDGSFGDPLFPRLEISNVRSSGDRMCDFYPFISNDEF